jgi:hypothetical protein
VLKTSLMQLGHARPILLRCKMHAHAGYLSDDKGVVEPGIIAATEQTNSSG